VWLAAIAAAFLIALAWFLRFHSVTTPEAPLSATSLSGAWLTDLVALALGMLSLPWPMPIMLSVFSACAVGALLAWLYSRLRFNNWSPATALWLVGGLAAHPVIVAAVETDHATIPLMLACAVVVPAVRRLESVGDVQAEMGFGLMLPILFLAGPATAPLIPLLAVFGACSDPTARHDSRAFVAMLLVAVLPSLLVLIGLFGMLGTARSLGAFVGIYRDWYTAGPQGGDDLRRIGASVAVTILPFSLLTIAYCLRDDRRRQVWSAIAVPALPFYVAAGAATFSWPLAPTVPTAVLLAAYASWLSVARLTPTFRALAILLLLCSTLAGWGIPALR
jgi:hypothetical protein